MKQFLSCRTVAIEIICADWTKVFATVVKNSKLRVNFIHRHAIESCQTVH